MVSGDRPVNEPNGTSAVGSSWPLQGCLFGAVALFVVLLLTMIYFGYQQFREHTEPTPTVSLGRPGAVPLLPASNPVTALLFNGWTGLG
jgi:hypothetical protein